jgi:hypothetical protein
MAVAGRSIPHSPIARLSELELRLIVPKGGDHEFEAIGFIDAAFELGELRIPG